MLHTELGLTCVTYRKLRGHAHRHTKTKQPFMIRLDNNLAYERDAGGTWIAIAGAGGHIGHAFIYFQNCSGNAVCPSIAPGAGGIIPVDHTEFHILDHDRHAGGGGVG